MMEYIYAFLALLGGLGALLIGFKLLSDNIEKLANSGLRKLFNKTVDNPFVGVGIGALVTAVIQSSSATTVMIVGFVNAGIITLYQATALIMGANIGTTITAQIAALNSFDIAKFAIALTAVGAFMEMLLKKDKLKSIGLALCGLGLVFLGLAEMSSSMTIFRNSQAIVNILAYVDNPILLVLIGVGFTALIQSSSAVTTIVISMVSAGLIIGSGGNSALFVILGSNIGTCITALLSSINGNTNAKRASLIHLMFNTFGTVIFVLALMIWKSFSTDILETLFQHPGTQIAMFHTLFNIINTIVFLPFIKVFVKISELLIKDKKEKNQKITFMDERLLATPAVALSQLMKETVRLGDIAVESLNIAIDGFIKKDYDYAAKAHPLIEDVEILNKEIISYLVTVASCDLTIKEEKIISNLHHSLGDFIRLGEIADNIVRYTQIEIENDLIFSDSVFTSLNIMKDKLNELYNMTKEAFLNLDASKLEEIGQVEDEIDTLRTNLINDHIKRLEEGNCKPQSSGIYINLISNLERAGDHIHYIALLVAEE